VDKNIMKILLSASTGLGDFILKTPMIYLLGETFPNLSVDILVGNSWGVDQILANETNIQLQYFNLPKKKNFGALCKMFFSMRGNNYDYIILPYDATDRNLRWSALFFLKARFYLVHFSPRYKTLKGKAEALLLNFFSGNKIILVPVLKGHHEINANLDFARHIIDFPISSIGMRPKINPTPSTITNLNVGSNYIVIQPNAANGSQTPKVWNPDSFLELVQLLAAKYCDLKIVLVGDGGDRARLLEHALLTRISS
jgi:ADP-heptose:LPS heptosyltransferase